MKEEIKHFKAMLRQCSLRHMNILLDDKFQKELLNIIKDYENLQSQLIKEANDNKTLKSNWKALKEWLIKQRKYDHGEDKYGDTLDKMNELEKEND